MFGAPHLEVRRPSPTTVEFIVTTQPRRRGWTGWARTAAVVAVRVLLAAAAGAVLWAHVRQGEGGGHLRAAATAATAATAALRRQGRARHGGQGRQMIDNAQGDGTWWPFGTAAMAVARVLLCTVPTGVLDALDGVAAAPWWAVLTLCAAALWASVARVHTSESLLVLRGLGIQTRSTGATYLGDLVAGLGVVWWVLLLPWTLLARFFSISAGAPGGSGGGGGGGFGGFGFYREPTPAATRFIPTAKLQDLLVNEAFRGFEVRYYLVAVVAGRSSGRAAEDLGAPAKHATVEEGEEEEEDDDADFDAYDHDDANGVNGANHANGHRHLHMTGDGDEDDEDDEDEGLGQEGDGTSSDEDEDHVVVVFPRLLPGLDIVRTVWREARACLYEPEAMW